MEWCDYPFPDGTTDAWKWYDHEEDIVRIMRATGATQVVLHGEGEEQDDVWDKVFTLGIDDIDSNKISVTKYQYVLVCPSTGVTKLY